MEAARTAERLASRNIERRDARGVSLHPKHTEMLTVLGRIAVIMFFASPFWALLPTVAHQLRESATFIRVAPDRFRRRRDAGSAGATTSAVIFFQWMLCWPWDHGFCRRFMGHGDVQVHRPVVHSHCVGGAAWTNSDVTDEHSDADVAPDWVRARAAAIFMLVYMGAWAAGSAFWGYVAGHRGTHFPSW